MNEIIILAIQLGVAVGAFCVGKYLFPNTGWKLRKAAMAPTVNIFMAAGAAEQKVAVATDEVPEGALEDNEDGTVNVYDAAGKKTGTIPAAEAAAAAEGVTNIVVE